MLHVIPSCMTLILSYTVANYEVVNASLGWVITKKKKSYIHIYIYVYILTLK